MTIGPGRSYPWGRGGHDGQGVPQAAFSILALLVLLIVVGAAAVVAVRSTSDSIGQARHAESEQILRNVKRGVIGSVGAESASGGTPNSFFSDMGRVPRARTNLQGQLTLSELVSATGPGYSLPPYGTYLLKASNVVTPPIPLGANQNRNTSVPRWLEDANYQFRGGWRGPYYNTDVSGGRMVEGWGRDLAYSSGSPVEFLTYVDPDRYAPPADANRYKPWKGFTTALTNRTLVDGIQIIGSGLLSTPALQSDTYKVENHRTMFDDSGVGLFGDLLLNLTIFGKRGRFQCDIVLYAMNPDADQFGSQPIVAYYFTTFWDSNSKGWKSSGFLQSDVYIPHLPAGQKVIAGCIYTQNAKNENSPPGQEKNVTDPMFINIQAGRLNYAEFALAYDFLNLDVQYSPNNLPVSSSPLSFNPVGVAATSPNRGLDYPAASYVTVTAAPVAGYSFVGWVDRVDKKAPPLSMTPTLLIRMTQDWQVDAVYQKNP